MSARARRSSLTARLDELGSVVVAGQGRLDPDALAAAARVRARADERLARGDAVVVAAFCGGTGTGKSSLVNALARAPVARTGVRRPLTAEPLAVAAEQAGPTTAVLDWLGVRERHAAAALPAGLVLVDLPDQDSIVVDHRLVTQRFVERVDVLVWVVDPIKYAHRGLHEGWLSKLALHAEVVLAVLNRIDEVSTDDRADLLADLRRLLATSGLGSACVLATSARTSEGIDQLRAVLAERAATRRAVVARLDADLRTVAAQLAHGVGPVPIPPLDTDRLVEALAGAAGVDSIAAAAGREYQTTAGSGTRPIVSRVVWGAWSRVLGAVQGARTLVPGAERRRLATALPPATKAPIAVRHALLELAAPAVAALPRRWAGRLRERITRMDQDLPAHLANGVDAVRLRPPRRRWWRPVSWLLGTVELMALIGALWLALLGGLAWLQLPTPVVPDVAGDLPWPTALLLGGGLARILLGIVRSRLIRAGGSRHTRAATKELRAAVEAVATEEVLGPLTAELADHDRIAAGLTRLSLP